MDGAVRLTQAVELLDLFLVIDASGSSLKVPALVQTRPYYCGSSPLHYRLLVHHHGWLGQSGA
jgi:hypothetical protein